MFIVEVTRSWRTLFTELGDRRAFLVGGKSSVMSSLSLGSLWLP